MRPAGRAVWTLFVALVGPAAGATAQVPTPDSIPPPPVDSSLLDAGEFRARAELPRPWSSIVSVSLLIPAGAASDPSGAAGAMWLLGHTVKGALEDRDPDGLLGVRVDVTSGYTLFQAAAEPDRWREVQDALLGSAFDLRLPAAVFERERARLVESLVFESGAPGREFHADYRRLAYRTAPGWHHDPRGELVDVSELPAETLRGLRESTYDRRASVLAAVGATGTGHDRWSRPEPARDSTLAWLTGERVDRVADVTSAWIGIAYPLLDAPRTVLEFIAYRVRQRVNPDPPDPALFGSRVDIVDFVDGPVLEIESAVLPEARDRWERHVRDVVSGLAERHSEPGFVRLHRRRFRNQVVMALADPEADSRRVAFDLLRDGDLRDVGEEIWTIDPAALARVVTSFGEPRILVYGPDLSGTR